MFTKSWPLTDLKVRPAHCTGEITLSEKALQSSACAHDDVHVALRKDAEAMLSVQTGADSVVNMSGAREAHRTDVPCCQSS